MTVWPDHPAETNPAMTSRADAERKLRRFVDRNCQAASSHT
jgi:hypothetical protein